MVTPNWPHQDNPEYRVTDMHRRRVKLWSRIDDWAETNIPGGYAAYALGEYERVGVYDATLREVEQWLKDAGFQYEPIAALKTDWDGRVEAGSWARREHPKAEKQLHCHLFLTENGRVAVGGHLELNWKRHPIRHYKPSGISIGGKQIIKEGYYDPSAGVSILKPLLDDES